ncbi:hypothetical protein [Actinomadura atramentaria]|uniref:hypothetical protein n=1 Tax=Actinomadura atramentaria TaxID=1990 RepID=UPI000363F7C1|nr:hypothetical protein [Actinomadura atramentaria]
MPRLIGRTRAKLTAAVVAVTTAASAAAVAVAPAASAYAPIFTVVNADGGVYWRNSPNWSDTSRIPGWGVYNGDRLALNCYAYGGAVAPYGNTLWYYAVDLSRGPVDQYGNHPSGWVSDHYLNTPGTAANPQPQTLPCW